MRILRTFGILSLVFFWSQLFSAAALAASVAVFPLQEFGEWRNDANLPLTHLVAEQLRAAGNDIIDLKTVIAFMANNRIRALGHMESYHVTRVRSDLGADFALLGTVSQRRERPEPALALTLNLIRTSDGRTVWSYIGSLSRSDELRALGVGEPRSVEDLQPLLLADLVKQWPWQTINEVQHGSAINLDLVRLEPRQLRPGDALYSQVRLREVWPAGQAPRVFFRADDQLFPATLASDGRTYEASWVAGGTDGKYPVTLLLEWPHYGRVESTLLGSYLIDGTPPLFELELQGAQMLDGRPVFSQQVGIIPQHLVRKALNRWRLSFFAEGGIPIGDMSGEGDLPERFVWEGRANFGRVEDGLFQVVLEAWDLAGNHARAEKWLEVNRSLPQIALQIDESSGGDRVDLENRGKVPLEFWRMEMWTSEGRILAREEGATLPVKISLDLAGSELDEKVRGFVFVQDVLGNQVRRTLEELLPNLGKTVKEDKAEKTKEISEKWVDEF